MAAKLSVGLGFVCQSVLVIPRYVLLVSHIIIIMHACLKHAILWLFIHRYIACAS